MDNKTIWIKFKAGLDTSTWSAEYPAFNDQPVSKMKICHFDNCCKYDLGQEFPSIRDLLEISLLDGPYRHPTLLECGPLTNDRSTDMNFLFGIEYFMSKVVEIMATHLMLLSLS